MEGGEGAIRLILIFFRFCFAFQVMLFGCGCARRFDVFGTRGSRYILEHFFKQIVVYDRWMFI